MIDQATLYSLNTLIFLSDHLRAVFGASIIITSVLLMTFILKKAKKQNLAQLEARRRRSQPPRRTSPPSYQPTQSIVPKKTKMPPIHVDSTDVEDSSYDAEVIKDKAIYFLSKVEVDGAEFKRIKGYPNALWGLLVSIG